MITEEIKTVEKDGFTIKIEVIDFCEGSIWFNELYTASEHKAGGTIQVPRHLQDRNSHKHYIGQTTPAELTKCYASQGRENPSAEAYKSLQDELGWYITAADCAIRYTISKAGIELDSTYGTGFDHSFEYSNQDWQTHAEEVLVDEIDEKIAELIKTANEILTKLAEVK